MAQEFNIPGLSEAIKEVTKLTEVTDKLAKDLLTTAINAEKTMSAFKGNSGLKEYVEVTKKSKEETDKLEVARKKLVQSQSDEAKELAKLNLAIQQQNQVNKAQAQTVELTDAAIKKEATSISEARAQIALLTQARNNVNLTTTEGQLKLISLNDALDKNNKFIKDNADATLKQKLSIGDYGNSVTSALEKTGLFSGKIGDLSRTAIDFVQSGAQAVKKVQDLNDNVVTGAKNVGSYVSAKLGIIQAEKASAVAINASTLATQGNIAATEENAVANVALATTTEGVAVAEGTATAATSVLDVALGILLAPITLIVLAFAALVYVFKDFAPLVNPIKDAFKAIGAVFELLKTSIFEVATGAKSLTEVFSDFGGKASEAASEAMKLAQAEREVIKAQRELEISSAKASAEITKLMVQSRNRTLDENVRMDMLKKAIQLEEVNVAKKLALNNKEIENARLKLSESKNISEEDMKELAKGNANYAQSIKKKYNLDQEYIDNLRKLQVQRYGLIEDSSRVTEKANNFIDRIADQKEKKDAKRAEDAEKAKEKAEKQAEEAAKKELERQKKSAEIAISTMKATLDYQIYSYNQSEKLDEENVAHVQAISLMKIQIANAEMAKNLIGVKKGSLDEIGIRNATAQEILKIENERSKALENIQSNRAKFELALYDVNTQLILDQEGTLTDLLINEQKNRIKESLQLHKDALREELKIDKDTTDEKLKLYEKTGAKLSENETKYLAFIKTQEAKAVKDSEKLDKALLDSKLKAIDTQIKNENRKFRLLNAGTLANNVFELKQEDKKLREERKLQEKNAEKVAEIDLQIAENKQKLDLLVAKNKEETLNRTLDLIIGFAGKDSEIAQKIAIARTIIDTIEQSGTAFKTAHVLASNPATAPLAPNAYLQGALIIGEGALKVSEIMGVKAFATGTDYAPYGKHIVDEEGAELIFSRGGQLITTGSDKGAHFHEFKGGETVIPADISAIIKQSLFASYGMNTQQIQQSIDYDMIEKSFSKSLNKVVNAVNANGKNQLSVVVQKNINDLVTFKRKRT